MLWFLLDFGLLPKVDPHAVSQNGLAVQYLADLDGIFSSVEADDYASEALEWREGVNSGMLVDGVSYAFEVGGCEDLKGVKIGDDEGVARRSR